MSRVPANVKKLLKENNQFAAAKEHSHMLHTGNVTAGWHEKDFQVILCTNIAELRPAICHKLCHTFKGVPACVNGFSRYGTMFGSTSCLARGVPARFNETRCMNLHVLLAKQASVCNKCMSV